MTTLYPWHASTYQKVVDLLEQDRLPHALGLSSPPGWGIDQLAGLLASRLLERTGSSAEGMAHPDLRWIVPDGAVIKIEQVRGLVDFANQTAQIAPRKVAVILQAETANANAANALLKTLEEPPGNTHIILATEAWGRMLPTIRSRCQRFAIETGQDTLTEWLAQNGIGDRGEGFALDLFALDLFALEHGRSPLEMLAAMQPEDDSHTLSVKDWVSHLAADSLSDLVKVALEGDVAKWLSRWYRVLQPIAQTALEDNKEYARQLMRFSDKILDVRRQIVTSNAANERLLIEYLVLEWRKLSAHEA